MTTDGGRVALVTGAARGMGAHVAERLARDGYELAVADVRSCDETAATIGAAGGRATGYECDISDWDAVGELVEAIERDQGPLHAVAQVAGVYRNVPFLELDPAGWGLLMDVNVDGSFHVTRHAARPMAERGRGSIVLISSTASWLVWDTAAALHRLEGGDRRAREGGGVRARAARGARQLGRSWHHPHAVDGGRARDARRRGG